MYRSMLLAFITILFFACNEEHGSDKINHENADAVANYDSAYQPPVFTDPDRLVKIENNIAAIDSLYYRYASQQHIPGLAFGIIVDGKLIHKGNVGYTDIEKRIPVSSASLFRIASMTKSFTAMSILKLRDEGKLDLDDRADKYITELKDLKYLSADAPVITIRHLLTHGAGFPEDNPWGDRQLADSDKDLLELLKTRLSFSSTTATTYEYSNLGFALLGKIITKVSGKRYQDYIRENIWKPLGMNTTGWKYKELAPDKLAHGYRWLNEKWNEEQLLDDPEDGSWGAMGSMITSIDEFSNYVAMHLNAWPPSNSPDNGLLKRSSLREMHHPWRFNSLNSTFTYTDGRLCPTAGSYCYGLNWMRDCDGRVYVGHSGGLPGFGSNWRMLPDYGIAVVAFANRTYAPIANLNVRVLDTMIKLAGLQPRVLPASRILEQRKNELVSLLPSWNNAEASKIFAENFFPDYPIDSLRKQANDLYAKAGKIISVTAVKPENQLRGSFVLKGELSDIEISFTLSPESPPLIQAFRIKPVIDPNASAH